MTFDITMSTKRENIMDHEGIIHYDEHDLININEMRNYDRKHKLLSGDVQRIIMCIKFFFESSDEFIFVGSDLTLYDNFSMWRISLYDHYSKRHENISKLSAEFYRLFPTSQSWYNVLWFIEYLIYNEMYSIRIDVDELTDLKNVYHSIIDGLGDISVEDAKSVISKIETENSKQEDDIF